jgi:uncharacterized pyridoxamine 5'-phosphate oxidase family protein
MRRQSLKKIREVFSESEISLTTDLCIRIWVQIQPKSQISYQTVTNRFPFILRERAVFERPINASNNDLSYIPYLKRAFATCNKKHVTILNLNNSKYQFVARDSGRSYYMYGNFVLRDAQHSTRAHSHDRIQAQLVSL